MLSLGSVTLYCSETSICFTVYHSNQVDVLKSLLVELIRREPLQNPFTKSVSWFKSPGVSQVAKNRTGQRVWCGGEY